MHREGTIRIAAAACGAFAALAAPAFAAELDREAIRAQAASLLGPLPSEVPEADNPFSEAKIELGRLLYYDPRLSRSQEISCNSCHRLDAFGVDGEPTSPGHGGQRGERNSPSVYNAALHIAQFWDGRAPDVEEQAKGPVLNPVEMAMRSEEATVAVLASIPGYPERFAEAFPDDPQPVSYDNMALAIGAFERRLLTPSRFDRFLEGQLEALSDDEIRGLQTFMNKACTSCHLGPGVGGGLYQKLGLVKPYPTEDTGRYGLTGDESDRYFFKVPSLRNVAETGPYFHDGSIASLDRAIRLMGEHQLGIDLSKQEIASIRLFLESLTGSIDAEYVARPELPPSGPQTPAPDPS